MKTKNTVGLAVLRSIKSVIEFTEKSGGTVDDLTFINLVRKLVKQREDSVEAFTKGGRQELADKEFDEIQILKTFLPAELTEQQIVEICIAAINEVGAVDKKGMGKAIKVALEKADGRIDNKTVSQTISKLLP